MCKKYKNIVELLLQQPKIDIHVGSKNGTALFYAAQNDFVEIATLLLEHDQFKPTYWCDNDDIREKIFEPFFTTRSQGTGLGLAVVKSVAKSHHGDVSVSNGEREGAVFTIQLPLCKRGPEQNCHGRKPTTGAVS